jgi:hypothetical protein
MGGEQGPSGTGAELAQMQAGPLETASVVPCEHPGVLVPGT